MPTNYKHNDSLEKYIESLSYLHALMIDVYMQFIQSLLVTICSPNSRFFVEYVSFAKDNNLIMPDLNCLDKVVSCVVMLAQRCRGSITFCVVLLQILPGVTLVYQMM